MSRGVHRERTGGMDGRKEGTRVDIELLCI